MPASYPVGLAKVEAGTHPRLLIVSGDEVELRKRVARAYTNVVANHVVVDVFNGKIQTEPFIQGPRTSKDSRFYIPRAERCHDWDWLPKWFNQVKRAYILLETEDDAFAERIAKVANTRAIHIGCSAPSGEAARSKIIKLITGWYSESPTQVNLLLNKNNWKISPCLQLLDKLALLNLPLTSDTIMSLGVVRDPVDEFIEILTSDNAALALGVIPHLNRSDYGPIVVTLSQWLDKLARVKSANTFMKSPHELAFEVGIPSKETEKLVRLSRKYDLVRINKIALALAAADKDIANGYSTGIMEILVTKW